MQIRIELLTRRHRLAASPFSVRKSISCFKTMLMPEKIGDFSPSPRAAERPSSKLSTIGNQPLEERAVGVFDRLLFLARSALLVILEIGLAAQGQIAKPIEIRLQTAIGSVDRRTAIGSGGARPRSAPGLPGCRSVLGVFGYWNFSHVLRMAIKVMSSFCGCEPTKLRSIIDQSRDHRRRALRVRWRERDWTIRSKPNSSPFRVERFGHSVGVKNQAIVALERDSEIARYPIEHASAVNSQRPFRGASSASRFESRRW